MKLLILLICTALATVGGDGLREKVAPQKRVVRHLVIPSFWDWPDTYRRARKPIAPARNQCSGPIREVGMLRSDIQNQKYEIQRQKEEIRRQSADINTQAGEIQRQRTEIHKQTEEIQRQRAEIHKQTGEIQRQSVEIHKQKAITETLMIVIIVLAVGVLVAGTVAGFASFWWFHYRKKVITAEQHSGGLQESISDQNTGRRRSDRMGRSPGHKLPTLARHDSENSLYEPFTMP